MPLNTNTSSSQDQGVTGAAKFVTSTLGNTVGGVSKTVGGSTGKPVGDALGNIGSGLEDGLNNIGKGIENAGQWKR
ncbi:hypothetical protein BDV12DRAFT_197093 [Aspergillus spectabilis]